MSDWEHEVNGIDVRRTGEDASIYNITVEGERTRRGYNSYSRVRLDFEYSVREDDGRASLKHAERADSNHRDGVSVHHLVALLPAVERAVDAVPGVEWVEPFEDAVARRRPHETDADADGEGESEDEEVPA